MTKLTKIDVADIEPLLNRLIFNLNGTGVCGLLVGDAKKLLDKINPPQPTLVEILARKFNAYGQTAAMKEEWGKMYDLARAQERKIVELEATVKKHMLTSTDRFTALHKIAYHEPSSIPWFDAYTDMKNIARDALQEKS